MYFIFSSIQYRQTIQTFVRSYPFKISIIMRSSLFFVRSYLRSYKQLNKKKKKKWNKTRSFPSRKKAKNFFSVSLFLRLFYAQFPTSRVTSERPLIVDEYAARSDA